MPSGHVGKIQRKCVCVNDASVNGWRGPIWILRSQRRIVMSDWMMRLWIRPEWSSLFVLILSPSVSLPLSLTCTHLHPCGLWQDYQTQAGVQLGSLPSHATQHHRGDCKLYFCVPNCSSHRVVSSIFQNSKGQKDRDINLEAGFRWCDPFLLLFFCLDRWLLQCTDFFISFNNFSLFC